MSGDILRLKDTIMEELKASIRKEIREELEGQANTGDDKSQEMEQMQNAIMKLGSRIDEFEKLDPEALIVKLNEIDKNALEAKQDADQAIKAIEDQDVEI